jgi:hypothetical protein
MAFCRLTKRQVDETAQHQMLRKKAVGGKQPYEHPYFLYGHLYFSPHGTTMLTALIRMLDWLVSTHPRKKHLLNICRSWEYVKVVPICSSNISNELLRHFYLLHGGGGLNILQFIYI